MSTTAEIEEAIAELSEAEFRELLCKMKEREAGAWDRETERDAQDGKLDACVAQLEEENAGEAETSLDDFLDQTKVSKAL